LWGKLWEKKTHISAFNEKPLALPPPPPPSPSSSFPICIAKGMHTIKCRQCHGFSKDAKGLLMLCRSLLRDNNWGVEIVQFDVIYFQNNHPCVLNNLFNIGTWKNWMDWKRVQTWYSEPAWLVKKILPFFFPKKTFSYEWILEQFFLQLVITNVYSCPKYMTCFFLHHFLINMNFWKCLNSL
jgi:hypothetical protein